MSDDTPSPKRPKIEAEEVHQLRKALSDLHERIVKIQTQIAESSVLVRNISQCVEILNTQEERVEKVLKTKRLLTNVPNYRQLLEHYEKEITARCHNSILILGPKGCGKTTSLYLLWKELSKHGEKALYVDLG